MLILGIIDILITIIIIFSHYNNNNPYKSNDYCQSL